MNKMLLRRNLLAVPLRCGLHRERVLPEPADLLVQGQLHRVHRGEQQLQVPER